jgi:acetyltransferase-like isoleucine patch superfamily enzyme
MFLIRIIYRSIRFFREYLLLRKVKFHKGEIFVGGPTKLTMNTILGKNPNFNGLIISGNGEVKFGDNFHSGSECLFMTSNHNYEGAKIPYDETHIIKNIEVGNNVWLGNRVIILGGVTIGEGAIIQAGAVVHKNVPKCGIAGGNPAKVFKYRNEEHYELKKKNKMFH